MKLLNLSPCPSCGCLEAKAVVTPEFIHQGKLVCDGCGRFLRWIEKPENHQKRQEQQIKIQKLLTLPTLSSWDREFLSSIFNQKKLSLKQLQILERIENKVGRGQ